ncbi:MAG TPA: hypothetical protein VJ376_09735 [Pseudomonadota bacterium]|nr:hypothetical protein [Pseudomonadota bacterium]
MRASAAILSMSLFAASAAFAYETIEVTNGATITGVVKVTGKTAAPAPIAVYKNREVCGAHVENESLVVGPGNGLRYAVVTIVDITRGKAVETEAVNTLDNARCRFVPHVQAVSVGQFIELNNTDPILHNADAVLDKGQTLFNVALWPGRELRRPIAYPGVIRFNCDVHPWMSAYAVATVHPYHAVTDLYGAYVRLRAGEPALYALARWSGPEPRLRPGQGEVTISRSRSCGYGPQSNARG